MAILVIDPAGLILERKNQSDRITAVNLINLMTDMAVNLINLTTGMAVNQAVMVITTGMAVNQEDLAADIMVDTVETMDLESDPVIITETTVRVLIQVQQDRQEQESAAQQQGQADLL